MAFVNRIFHAKKTRTRDECVIDGSRAPEINGSPKVSATRASPGGGAASGVGGAGGGGSGGGRYTPQRRQHTSGPSPSSVTSASPKSPSSRSSHIPDNNDGKPTQEEIDSMNLPFIERPINKRDKSLSISRSGRHKYKSKQRMSVLQHDIYSDIPADKELSPPSTSSSGSSPSSKAPSGVGGLNAKSMSSSSPGYRGSSGTSEPHARQYQRPSLAISGASAAV